mmetsp:Transcript_49453/g.92560  ORF Transcript_49453/g.92560 Transcript_49453/m.92560 type:complete len:215 (-) Transcript_49453:1565-2209(-)
MRCVTPSRSLHARSSAHKLREANAPPDRSPGKVISAEPSGIDDVMSNVGLSRGLGGRKDLSDAIARHMRRSSSSADSVGRRFRNLPPSQSSRICSSTSGRCFGCCALCLSNCPCVGPLAAASMPTLVPGREPIESLNATEAIRGRLFKLASGGPCLPPRFRGLGGPLGSVGGSRKAARGSEPGCSRMAASGSDCGGSRMAASGSDLLSSKESFL